MEGMDMFWAGTFLWDDGVLGKKQKKRGWVEANEVIGGYRYEGVVIGR